MNTKVIRLILAGIALYAVFVFMVIAFYPDKPENMDWKDREEYNRVQITKLKLGSTREEVLALLGSPDITEAKRQGATAIQVMFFRTQHVRADGLTTQDECTPLLFENDKLIAWGDGAYSSYQKLEGWGVSDIISTLKRLVQLGNTEFSVEQRVNHWLKSAKRILTLVNANPALAAATLHIDNDLPKDTQHLLLLALFGKLCRLNDHIYNMCLRLYSHPSGFQVKERQATKRPVSFAFCVNTISRFGWISLNFKKHLGQTSQLTTLQIFGLIWFKGFVS